VDLETTFALLRVFAGLVIAAHGAQKVLGMFGGPGMGGFTKMVEGIGFRPAPVWAAVAAYGELVGGLMLAAGLLTGIVAGILVVDMIVAIWKVKWAKGFWSANGGYEFDLTLLTIFGLFGLAGPGAWSLDAPLRLASWTMLLFAATVAVGLFGVWSGARPAEVARTEEARRRRAA
jgi:putative oxidoreductase